MSCKIYLQKYDYSGVLRGQRKKLESRNGLSLLDHAVKDEYGLDLTSLEIERGIHGKPYFKDRRDICFNISHSGDYAAAALCSREVGVDIQVFRHIKDNVINKLCRGAELEYIGSSPDRDRAFIMLWALKESYIKATGDGMTFPMSEVNFDIRGFDGELVGRVSNREGLYLLRDCGSFALAACVL